MIVVVLVHRHARVNVCLRVHDEATAAIRVVAADTAVVRLDRQPGKRRRAFAADRVRAVRVHDRVKENVWVSAGQTLVFKFRHPRGKIVATKDGVEALRACCAKGVHRNGAEGTTRPGKRGGHWRGRTKRVVYPTAYQVQFFGKVIQLIPLARGLRHGEPLPKDTLRTTTPALAVCKGHHAA